MSRSLPNTPYKLAITVSVVHKKPSVAQIVAAMDRELKNTLHTIETKTFLERFIPTITTINKCFWELKKDGQYTGTRWTEFPKEPPSNEKQLYKPLATILNAIVRTVSEDKIRTKIIYVDRHNSSPKSIDEDMAAGRPDGAGAHPDANLTELENKILDRENRRTRTRADAARNKEAMKEDRKERQHLVSAFTISQCIPC